MTSLRVLIVDDEARARANLLHLLNAEPDVTECRVCIGGAESIAEIGTFRPDLVFLDVQMPEVDGFEVVRRIGLDRMPAVVFVTAHQDFALGAFDVHAVDYLLKPVADDRFAMAMRRARERIAGMDAVRVQASKVVLREGARTLVLETAEIDFVSAEDYCINIFSGDRSHLVRETLAAFAAQLDPKRFVRVHRSALVNVDRVLSVRTLASGRIVVELKNGRTLPVSRSRARALQEALGAGR